MSSYNQLHGLNIFATTGKSTGEKFTKKPTLDIQACLIFIEFSQIHEMILYNITNTECRWL